MKHAIFAVYAIYWEESERGWGTRPDGASFHCSVAEGQAYLKQCEDAERKRNPSGEVPDEYDRPVNTVPTLVRVKKDFYDRVMQEKTVRVWRHQMRDVVIPEK